VTEKRTLTQPARSQREHVASPILHYINGEFRPSLSGRTFDSLSPMDNKPIASAAEGQPEDIHDAVMAARRAFEEVTWSQMPPKRRAAYLRKIADGIEARGEELAHLECLDTGMPITQARGQAARAAENFRFFASVIENIHHESYPVGNDFINYSVTKPVGVAGLITPWNTPFMLETWKVAPCLAAGDTCVLKPAEWSPVTAGKLAEIINEVGLPPGVFNVVHGYGETAGAPLVAHDQVDLISFTGETTTGQAIVRNGASTLKRYSMELGGKSPVSVFGDADFDEAVDGVIFGAYSLNGERCTAGSRLLVEEGISDRFIAAVAERSKHVIVGDPMNPDTELGPLIHPDHFARVMNYVRVGEAEGARLGAGGKSPKDRPNGNYLEATFFTNVRPDMRIFQEEIFGPVLVATTFKDEQEAVRLANDVQYGLAAYVWTTNVQRAHRVAQAVNTGMVWINSHNVRDLRTPFGGVKRSGFGREGGEFSFEFYCDQKAIHTALKYQRVPTFGRGVKDPRPLSGTH
jgi:5-carboxymethyl-2-hydroxymuconic-semialdehyde dehydrogenase